MNTVILLGRWAQDVELRYTPNGKEVASGNLAVSDGYGDKKHTSYIPIVIWGKVAENTAQYAGEKGRQVAIEGRLSQRSYEKDGQKRYVLEVVASNVEFVGSKEKKEQQGMSDPFSNSGEPINISDDDLPF